MFYWSALRGAQVIAAAPPSASPRVRSIRLYGARPALVRIVMALVAAAASVLPVAAAERDPAALLDRLETAWSARDVQAYLALWRASAEQRAAEREYATATWEGDESRLEIERPAEAPPGAFRAPATIVSIAEPRD